MARVPDLNIPSSSITVQVRIIDTTARLGNLDLSVFCEPQIDGLDKLYLPAYAFLVEHPSGRKVLFDLGVRKDHQNYAPTLVRRIQSYGWTVDVKKGVREQLEDHAVSGADIEAIIWSHWHWDHIGDPSTFEKHTTLVVGPGFKEAFIPAYPTKPDAVILESDFLGRELREISFQQSGGLKIGRFNAFDYFGDGSFYLLDSPGHAIGHLCGMARTTSSPDSFIFMGADACHHGGEFRPSRYLPMPDSILPSPLNRHSLNPCPGAMFDSILRDGDKTKPIFVVARPKKGTGPTLDPDEAERTIEKVQEADARADIFVVVAHDDTLLDIVDFFPKYSNDFVKKGWVNQTKWAFLKDFEKAIKPKVSSTIRGQL